MSYMDLLKVSGWFNLLGCTDKLSCWVVELVIHRITTLLTHFNCIATNFDVFIERRRKLTDVLQKTSTELTYFSKRRRSLTDVDELTAVVMTKSNDADILDDKTYESTFEDWRRFRSFSRGSSICQVGTVYDEHVPRPHEVRLFFIVTRRSKLRENFCKI